MNDDGFYTPEEGAAIATFIEQLPYICGETLSRGVWSGDEWVVGDFQKSRGKSCRVNVKTGCFFDHNPAADPKKAAPSSFLASCSATAATTNSAF
jgi:hypothetical protein